MPLYGGGILRSKRNERTSNAVSNPLLSIVIVNYKVPHFLEQCLLSIRSAAHDMDVEVIVVDNASGDGSIELLSPRFPDVTFIQSKENLGFSKASNWGYQMSKGRYVLFLNPDTLLSEDSLKGPIDFLESRTDDGALGIRMIDGSGRFLPESKRAFPDPLTAFYKVIGLSKLFPRSPRFARYHLGHLSDRDDHVIDVVSGAYFLVRRSVLEKVGVFDESFFMYGEDIDLSYRIQRAGYVNYYYAGSTILHFKGESTQKQQLRYVKLFYGAMSQFVQKHRTHAGWFRAGIQAAIALRASLSILRRSISTLGIPTFDSLLILFCFFSVRSFWSVYIRPEVSYPTTSMIAFALQALLFFITAFVVGLYRKPFQWGNYFKVTAISTTLLLAVYSLLPETLRYSRGIVAFSSLLSIVVLAAWRRILLFLQLISTEQGTIIQFPLLVIGSPQAQSEIKGLYPEKPGAAFLHIDPLAANGPIPEKVRSLRSFIAFSDIVFCPGALSASETLALMQSWRGQYSFRFHVEGSRSVICSNCIVSPLNGPRHNE